MHNKTQPCHIVQCIASLISNNTLPSSVVCSKPLQTDWTQIWPGKSGSDLFDTQIMRWFFEKNTDFEKNQQTKKHEKFPSGQRVNYSWDCRLNHNQNTSFDRVIGPIKQTF